MKRPMVALLVVALLVLTASSAMAARTNLRISPRSINFGGQIADADPNTATTLGFVVINKNRTPVAVNEWSIEGDTDGAFSINTAITDDNCFATNDTTLAHRETCNVWVTFNPTTAGSASATLLVRETTFETAVTASLSGVSVSPA